MNIEIISLTREYDLLKRFTATAELAWGLLIMCIRNMRPMVRQALAGQWQDKESFRGQQLSNMTLVVQGFGRLGKMTARYGRAFCKRVLACDTRPFSEVFQERTSEGIEVVDIETLLRESDAISINMAPENYQLFNAAVFSKMKHGAVLVNTSRCDVIDEQALIDALDLGKLKAFGADVLHNEWRQSMTDQPVIQYAQNHDNVVITPHMGGGTLLSLMEARRFMGRKLLYFLTQLASK